MVATLVTVVATLLVVVPQAAVQANQSGYFVLVLEEGDVVQPRPVKLGQLTGTDWAVDEGLTEGETIVVPRTDVRIEENRGLGLAEISESTSLSDVIEGLNALGVAPYDMIDILKSIKAAGALHAEFIVR